LKYNIDFIAIIIAIALVRRELNLIEFNSNFRSMATPQNPLTTNNNDEKSTPLPTYNSINVKVHRHHLHARSVSFVSFFKFGAKYGSQSQPPNSYWATEILFFFWDSFLDDRRTLRELLKRF